MSCFTFERGNLNTIMLTVLGLSNTALQYPQDYSLPKVRISHANGGFEVEDLAETDMVQIASTNRWYYKYTIPEQASFTRYLVTFKSAIQGANTFAIEEFKVVPPPAFPGGTGEFNIQIRVASTTTGQPVSDTTVDVYAISNPSVLLATDTSNAEGLVNVYLNAGIYLINFRKTGKVTESHKLTVNSDGTYTLEGN